jgi:hypothetical protein
MKTKKSALFHAVCAARTALTATTSLGASVHGVVWSGRGAMIERARQNQKQTTKKFSFLFFYFWTHIFI